MKLREAIETEGASKIEAKLQELAKIAKNKPNTIRKTR